ncbi:MAG: hypothetical protein GQ533_11470 [Methanosarcinaceae archaeon]|nr:hypothetical protein [Methanosarcinaceae archaeon]
MVVIRNKLDQKIIINLNEGKSIFLLSKGTADVSDEDFSSRHLQKLIAKGAIIKSHHDKKPDAGPIITDKPAIPDEPAITSEPEIPDEPAITSEPEIPDETVSENKLNNLEG